MAHGHLPRARRRQGQGRIAPSPARQGAQDLPGLGLVEVGEQGAAHRRANVAVGGGIQAQAHEQRQALRRAQKSLNRGEGGSKILNLLNGTEYFPRIAGDIILCIEDDSYDSILETFKRNFQSVVQQPYFRQVKAILIGRFQQESQPTEQALRDIILSKNIEQTMPVIANLDRSKAHV